LKAFKIEIISMLLKAQDSLSSPLDVGTLVRCSRISNCFVFYCIGQVKIYTRRKTKQILNKTRRTE